MSDSLRIKQPAQTINSVLFLLMTCALAYISVVISGNVDMETRIKLVAYCALFAICVFATSMPGALIPDRLLPFHQLVNTSPKRLFQNRFRQWLPIILCLLLPPLVVALYEPGNFAADLPTKVWLILLSWLVIIATGLYSFLHYYTIGPKSQAWQEGNAGHTWDKLVEYNPTIKPPLPRGLLPALSATTRVFVIGILPLVAGLKLQQFVPGPLILVPAVLWLAWTLWRATRMRPVFDRFYYHSNAFYNELFKRGSISISDRAPVAYDAVYWVPQKWRAHTWASLLQFDRVLPVGRFMTVGVVIYWIMSTQNPPGTAVNSAFLFVLLVVKNLTIYTLTKPKLAPNLIEATFQSRTGWSMTRFFVNLRWTMPAGLALLAVALFSSQLSYAMVGLWVGIDITLAFLAAWGVTYFNHKFQRTRFAT